MDGMLAGSSAGRAGGGAGDPLEEAKTLSQKAVEQYQSGRYQEALPRSRRALEIMQKVLGPEHPDITTSLNNLTAVHQALGAYDQTLPLYQRVLKIREKTLGPEQDSGGQAIPCHRDDHVCNLQK